ncbi:unnamed protein product [Camellia sinensis]
MCVCVYAINNRNGGNHRLEFQLNTKAYTFKFILGPIQSMLRDPSIRRCPEIWDSESVSVKKKKKKKKNNECRAFRNSSP